MSAQKMVNQTCLIELCSSVIPSVVCGAGVELTTGGCFQLLRRHPITLDLDARVEYVGVGGSWLAPHNLQSNPMVFVCLSFEPFSSGESQTCMAAAAH